MTTEVKKSKSTVDTANLKDGDYLSRIEYYKVLRKEYVAEAQRDMFAVENREGYEFYIDADILENETISCSQYDEEKKITRTELVEIFVGIGDTIFTVNYNKQLKEADAKAALHDLYANKGGKILSEKDYKAAVNKVLKTTYKGEERTLIGYKISGENNLGRTQVIDLEIADDPSKGYATNIRQIDHRTLNWLIYKRVKYVVK